MANVAFSPIINIPIKTDPLAFDCSDPILDFHL